MPAVQRKRLPQPPLALLGGFGARKLDVIAAPPQRHLLPRLRQLRIQPCLFFCVAGEGGFGLPVIGSAILIELLEIYQFSPLLLAELGEAVEFIGHLIEKFAAHPVAVVCQLLRSEFPLQIHVASLGGHLPRCIFTLQ